MENLDDLRKKLATDMCMNAFQLFLLSDIPLNQWPEEFQCFAKNQAELDTMRKFICSDKKNERKMD